MEDGLKKLSAEELRSFDGKEGRPCYVAYRGKVYDVSRSTRWKGGQHMRRHEAGRDLSAEMGGAPHDESVLERFPQVGVLVTAEPAAAEADAGVSGALPAALERFLARHPFFRRHPHPMTVHFPIVAMILAPLFSLLYLVTGLRRFEITSVHILVVGLVSSLFVIPTGFLTWWINYAAAPLRAVTIKITLSLAMLADGAAVLLWRLLDPDVLAGPRGPHPLYLVLMLLLLPMILVVGWYGASLTFPIRKESRRDG